MAKINLILEKQPSEDRLFDMDFSNKMRTGETIVSVDSTVSDPVGITFTPTTFSGQLVQMLVSAGDGPNREDVKYNEYKITVTVTTSTNQVLENDGFLRINDE